MTLEQARALSEAAEAYARICIGQLEFVEELARMDIIPCRPADLKGPRRTLDLKGCSSLVGLLQMGKHLLGLEATSSFSIGHPHVDLSARRAWEVRKVLNRALAMHRDPSPVLRGADYDGLVYRITEDAKPTAAVQVNPAALQAGDVA